MFRWGLACTQIYCTAVVTISGWDALQWPKNNNKWGHTGCTGIMYRNIQRNYVQEYSDCLFLAICQNHFIRGISCASSHHCGHLCRVWLLVSRHPQHGPHRWCTVGYEEKSIHIVYLTSSSWIGTFYRQIACWTLNSMCLHVWRNRVNRSAFLEINAWFFFCVSPNNFLLTLWTQHAM